MFRIRRFISLILILAVTLLTANFIYTPTLLASFFEENPEDGFRTLGTNAGSQYANENEDFSVFLGSPQNPTTLSFSRNGSSITINLENVSYQIEEEEILEEEPPEEDLTEEEEILEEPEEELLEEPPEEEVIETEEQIDEEESPQEEPQEPFDEAPSFVETTEDTQGEEPPPEQGEESQPPQETELPDIPSVEEIIDEVVDTIEDILDIGEPSFDESPEGGEPSEDQAQPEPSDEVSILPEPETEELLPDESLIDTNLDTNITNVTESITEVIEDATETIQETIEEVQETVEQAVEEVTEVAEEITAFFLSIPRAIAALFAKALAEAGDFFQNLIHTAFAIFEPGKETITLQDAYPGVDFTYTISQDGIKEQIILKTPGAPNEFTFKLDTQGVTKIKKLNKRIYFFNNQGESLFYIPAPFMVDAQGNRSEDISFSLRDQNGNDVLTASNANLILTPSLEWLSSSDRAWPVTIDPSISIDHSLKERPDMSIPSTQQYQHRDKDGNPTGTFTLYASVGPIQYQDENGNWQEIDTTFIPTSEPGFTHETASTEYKLLVNENTLTYRYYPKKYRGEYIEEILPQIGQGYVEKNTLNASSVTHELKLQARPEGTKFDLVLKERGAPLFYTTPITLNGLMIEKQNSEFALLNTDGTTVAYLRTPVALDSSEPPIERSLEMTYDESSQEITITLNDIGMTYPVTIDPTLNLQVGASADDGWKNTGDSSFSNSSTTMTIGTYGAGPPYTSEIWARFTGVSGLSGTTINSADYSVWPNSAQAGTQTKVRVERANAPTAPTSYTDYDNRTRTTAGVDWDGAIGTGSFKTVSITTVIQELANDFNPTTILLLHEDDGGPANNQWTIRTYDYGSSDAPKLDITYTPPNSAPTAPTTLFVGETDAQTGTANPTNVGDRTPMFSAICNDPDAGDIMNKYRIQVDNNSDFLSAEWDSGAAGTAMANCTAGSRSANTEFAGTPLLFDGQTFYWRIKFWDDDNTEGAFSGGTDTFQMLGPGKQMRHGKYFFNQATKRIFSW